VLIEARMIEASNEFATSVGIQWGGGLLMSQTEGNPTGLVFPNNVGVVGAVDGPASGQIGPTNYAVNLPSQDATTAIGLHLGSIGNVGFLSAKIAAAEANSEAKVISAPKITTMDNKPATITQGIQIPVVINNGLQGLATQFVNAALQLSVTPHVTADGSVLMDVNMTNNAPSGGTDSFGVPSVSTKSATTQMLVKDGDTAVIGGIYQRLEKKGMREVPFLSKIPVIGWLFKNYTASDSRSELLIFITPRVINRRQANIEATVVE
jgi:type IV pilus assembly protein PilQ